MSPRERGELVVVANRLPVTCNDDGDWVTSPGGLVSALRPVLAERGGAWVGAVPEDDPIPPAEVDGIRLVPVRIDEQEYHGYYEGFSNAALWPLYHHALREPVLDREEWWTNYQTVNTDLADAIAKGGGEGTRWCGCTTTTCSWSLG